MYEDVTICCFLWTYTCYLDSLTIPRCFALYSLITSTYINRLTPSKYHMGRDMRFPTMWYVRPAKAQTGMRMRTVWDQSHCKSLEYSLTVNLLTKFHLELLSLTTMGCTGSSESTLVKNVTLLEITCHGLHKAYINGYDVIITICSKCCCVPHIFISHLDKRCVKKKKTFLFFSPNLMIV